MQRGIYGSVCSTLGYVGNEECFDLLMEALKDPDYGSVLLGLEFLIRRSNKDIEPWMKDQKREWVERKLLWFQWWEENKNDFEIILTVRQAFGDQ